MGALGATLSVVVALSVGVRAVSVPFVIALTEYTTDWPAVRPVSV